MNRTARPVLRSSVTRLAVAGVATLASVTAGAPAALAAEDEVAPESVEPTVEEPAAPSAPAPVEEPATPQPAGASEQAPEAVPPTEGEEAPSEAEPERVAAAEVADVEYGAQSFTVSVVADPGDYFPDGVVDRGFYIEIVDSDGPVSSFECRAIFDADDGRTTPTSCTEEGGSTVFELAPGQRAIVSSYGGTQTPQRTIEPCAVDECSSEPVDVPFVAVGETPTANPREFDAQPGEPVTFDLLRGESVGDPATTVTFETAPAHGVLTSVPGYPGRFTYTSAEDFAGTDTFTYRITNSNGSASSTVTIDVAEDNVVPSFGSQKLRVGVQIDSGAYVPAGTTTAGSTFRIDITDQDGGTRTLTCTTGAADEDGASNCPGETIGIGEGLPISLGTYSLEAGETAVVTQTGTGGAALLPAAPQSVEPCDSYLESCGTVDLDFVNEGSILPETTPDEITAQQGGDPVVADVLANDTSEDPETELSLLTDLPAEQGTIEIVGEGDADPEPEERGRVSTFAVEGAGTLALRYTPSETFVGTIPVEYALTNSNGTTVETLTVTVVAADVDPTDPTEPGAGAEDGDDEGGAAASPAAAASLPSTGGPALGLLGLGALLTAAGAAMAARRRPAGTHER